MKRTMRILCVLVAVIMLMGSTVASAPQKVNSRAEAAAKNVIIMISDGMGFNTMLAADYYQYGKTGKQVYQNFPVKIAAATYEYEWDTWEENVYTDEEGEEYILCENPTFAIKGYDTNEMWSDFGYAIWTYPLNPLYINNATDSASSGTALATGTITKDGSIGVDVEGNDLENIVEIATALGKATGVVTSVPISHATPGAFVAHNPDRNDYTDIADQMIYNSDLDVLMGCGAPDYNNDGELVDPVYKYIKENTWNDISNGSVEVTGKDTWTVIRDKEDFQSLAEGSTPNRVLGIPNVNETLQYYRSPYDYHLATPAYEDPFTPGIPSLAEMTQAALNVLDNDEDGFFLMVEGGAVDWAGHYWQPGRLIEEQIDFNYAVEAVVKWVEENSNWNDTMLIVTADHETGYIWGPGSGEEDDPWPWKPIVNNGAGNMPDLEFYSVVYGFFSWHSNSLVPLFAKGDAARLLQHAADETDIVRGPYLHHIDTFQAMKSALTAERPGDKPEQPGKRPELPGGRPEQPGNRPVQPPGFSKHVK